MKNIIKERKTVFSEVRETVLLLTNNVLPKLFLRPHKTASRFQVFLPHNAYLNIYKYIYIFKKSIFKEIFDETSLTCSVFFFSLSTFAKSSVLNHQARWFWATCHIFGTPLRFRVNSQANPERGVRRRINTNTRRTWKMTKSRD